MSTPSEIEEQIATTRSRLSDDVNRLGEKVSPSAVVNRRVENVKSSAASLRDRVMGSSDNGSGLSGAKDAVSGKASDLTSAASGAASNAPSSLRRQTRGNPLAAGLIAF